MTSRFKSTTAEDASLETTVPTDLSFSPDEVSELYTTDDDRLRVERCVSKPGQASVPHREQVTVDRKQLSREIQQLRVELSQKNLKIDSIEAASQRKITELEQRLGETLHHRQQLQSRLDAQQTVNNDAMRRRQEAIARELDNIRRRQQQLEATNERLQEKAIDIRRSLTDLDLTDVQYQQLKLTSDDDVALKDFVAMKLYESQRPWKLDNENLKSRCKQLSDELGRHKQLLATTQDELSAQKELKSQLEMQHHRLNLAHADVKSQIQHGDYKIENYNRVKTERDEFERRFNDLQKQHSQLDSSHQDLVRQRDQLSAELAAAKQELTLLSKDKEFYSRQLCQVETKLRYADDHVIQLTEQMEKTKQAREALFSEYVASRDKCRSDYEEKLRTELEQIRVRTDVEVDRLKTSTREMYERENRSLREARDVAVSERDRALNAEKDTDVKYEQLLQDFRQLQLTSESQLSEVHNELKLKAFEADRTRLVHEETCRVLQQAQLDNEKLSSKLDVLTKEYYALQTSMERRVSELDAAVSAKSDKLATYEKLEHELDEVVLQAADVADDEAAERVLSSYGYGANVPTTAKRRLKQSVQLARRVLQLERSNVSLNKELERQQQRVGQLTDELKNANSLLSECQQPYQYLIESIRRRDDELSRLRQTLHARDTDLRSAENNCTELLKAKNQLALDLERLLGHKEEMAVMKQVLLNLAQPQYTVHSDKSTAAGVKCQSAAAKPSVTFEQAERDDDVYTPRPPTEFTAGPADWYSRLRHKTSRHHHKTAAAAAARQSAST